MSDGDGKTYQPIVGTEVKPDDETWERSTSGPSDDLKADWNDGENKFPSTVNQFFEGQLEHAECGHIHISMEEGRRNAALEQAVKSMRHLNYIVPADTILAHARKFEAYLEGEKSADEQ